MKKGLKILLTVLMIFVEINIAKALTFPQKLESVTFEKVIMPEAKEERIYYKTISSPTGFGDALCLSGPAISAGNGPCTRSGYDIGLGYIINYIKNNYPGTVREKYVAMELIEWRYYNISPTSTALVNHVNSKLPSGVTIDSIVSAARNQSSTQPGISVQPKTLTFTRNSDGTYYSNTFNVTVTGGAYDAPTTQGDFVVEKVSDNNYRYKIAGDKVTSTKSFTSRITASKTYYVAARYECGSGHQDYAPSVVDTKTVTNSAEVSGTVSPTKLIIKKVDKDGKNVEKATIKITSDSGYNETRETTSGPIVLLNIPYGKYTIEEIKSPDKYTLNNDKKTVTISESSPTGEVSLVNTLTSLTIKKLDEDGKNLAGARLQILDKDKKIFVLNGKKLEWITTDKPYVITGIPKGTYYLTEISAPDGYNVSDEEKKIVIDDKSTNLSVTFKNTKTRTEISKVSAVDGKELPGATLQILDEEGKEITDEEGNILYKWVSTDEVHVIEGLPIGKYKLRETIAPKGYVLSEETVDFEVTGDGTTTEVKMENELEVEVPDTLSSRSTLLLTIAMFDIALGIGIISYVKKNKIEE